MRATIRSLFVPINQRASDGRAILPIGELGARVG